MIRNYFKIAIRNILRSKVYSFINIAGLSLGIACCLLLYLYVSNELSYDQHRPRLADLYRIDSRFEGTQGFANKIPTVSPPILAGVADEVPEIEAGARMLNPPGVEENLIKIDDKVFYESQGYIADSTIIDVLGFELISGNPTKALAGANTVIISATMAKKLFGNNPALDKSITIAQGGDDINFKITGVFRDDQKSFLEPHFITSMMSDGWGKSLRTEPGLAKNWAGENFIPAYIRLTPKSSVKDVEKKMNDVLQRHGGEALKALGMKKTLFLEPVKDIYLRSAIDSNQRISWLYIIVSIAAFILIIACINFMNLSTAKSARRSTEIGMRKVMGAHRNSLAWQILGEAMIMVMISIVIAVVIVQISLPYFNLLTGKTISLNTENILYLSISLVALTIVTGLLAGSYPAFYISSFQPAQVLKGKISTQSSSGFLRQSLVVFQFVVAIVLVCFVIVIARQINFMKEKDLGFNADSKIIIPLRTQDAKNHFGSLKKDLLQNSAIPKVSGTAYVPGTPVFSDMTFYREGKSMEEGVDIHRNRVDEDYMSHMGIPLIAGRQLTDNRKLEEWSLVLNETAIRMLGFTPEESIGQPLHFDWDGQKYSFKIVGVMGDFNQNSLKEPIKPLMFVMPGDDTNYPWLVVSVPLVNFDQTIGEIEKIWKKNAGDTPFEYSFLDESMQKNYLEDRKAATIISVFAGLAIFICVLGLYGLSSFMAERRIKEIGVRKVLGAGVTQIVSMMSAEFVRLVGIAFIVATPLAWYGATQWLQGFEYKITLNALIFLSAGAGALLIALITVSYESIKAAMVNPVQSLRNE